MDKRIGKILNQELARRCERNPRYSLRSFAKAIGVSPANLSLVMNGKRDISKRTAKKILERVDLNAKDSALFLRQTGQKDLLPAENISLAEIERLCHWQCYAILSLMQTPDFISDETWIAQRLGVSVHEIRASVQALTETGVLITKGDRWKIKSVIRINNQVSTAVVRGFHRQLITKALESMENDPVELRDISSITFAMSPQKMKEAKEEIRRFRLRMADLLEEADTSTEVYNLTVQLAPATKGKK